MSGNGSANGTETITLELGPDWAKMNGEDVDGLVFAVSVGGSGTFRTRGKLTSMVSHLLATLGAIHHGQLRKEIDLW